MREFGSEHPSIVLPDDYFESLEKLGRDVTYLRSGREALLYAGINACNAKDKTILFPSYCCWSMSAPFEKSGWRVVYYRLNEDLTVNLGHLDSLLKTENPNAMLTMNFFGSANTNEAIIKAKSVCANIQIIEDFSHCTFCLPKIWNDNVDFYVSSIRKSIGICDGAVVLSKNECNKSYIQEEVSDFADKRFIAQTEKRRYAWNKMQEKKDEFLHTIRECEGIIDGFSVVRPISHRAKKMLKQINAHEIAFARRENMKHLWTLLKGQIEMVLGIERSFENEVCAPFSLPILVNSQTEIQRALAQEGVYTQLLWPICEEAKSVCSVSKKMNDRMLSVPIDQRYNWDDIEDIANIIVKICKKNY